MKVERVDKTKSYFNYSDIKPFTEYSAQVFAQMNINGTNITVPVTAPTIASSSEAGNQSRFIIHFIFSLGTFYDIPIWTNYAKFLSFFSAIETVPTAPLNLTANASFTVIVLSWNIPNPANGFVYQYNVSEFQLCMYYVHV